MSDYNGWKNYETRDVALWIRNVEGLYNMAQGHCDYNSFREEMDEMRRSSGEEDCPTIYICTQDSVSWFDSGLDIEALDEMIAGL